MSEEQTNEVEALINQIKIRDVEIQKLKEENSKLTQANINLGHSYDIKCNRFEIQFRTIKKLNSALSVLRGAVEFYGDTKSWKNSNGAKYYEQFYEISLDGEAYGRESIGGKKARETLASADKILKGELK